MATILIVDDDEANRGLLTALLGYAGHRTISAGDGLEALALARAHAPGLVICDILMPTMDGYEFVRQVRADPAVAHLQVIFYTATFLEREAARLARACGVTQVLVKPCEPEEILRIVELALQTAAPPGAVPTAEPPRTPDEFDREHVRLLTDKLSSNTELLDRAHRRLQALYELSLHLASERDPRALIEQFCRGARELFGARCALLGARAKNEGGGVEFAAWGVSREGLRGLSGAVLEAGVFGDVMRTRQARNLMRAALPPVVRLWPPELQPHTAMLIAPFASLNHVYGWIALIDKVGGEAFDDHDEQLLVAQAAHTGRIYENGSLYARVQRHAEALQREIVERQRALDDLRVSQARLSGLVENALDAIVSADEHRRIVLFNPAAERVFGYRADDVLGRELDCLLPTREGQTVPRQLADPRVLVSGTLAIHARRNGGEVFPVEGTVSVTQADGGRLYTAIFRDMSEQRQAEEKLQFLHRVSAMLSAVNALIVRVRERADLLDAVCRVSVDTGRFHRAWIVVDSEPADVGYAHCGAAADDDGRLERVVALRDDGHPLHETLVRRRRPLLVNDTRAAEAQHSPLLADADGAASILWLPLSIGDSYAGIMAFESARRDFFDDEEMRLLREMAGDVSFALDYLRQRDRIEQLAYYDPLTGMPNVALFRERVEQRLARAGDEPIALVMLDLERFKLVNDTLGRGVGDALLRQVAQRIEDDAHTRIVARVSADQFGVLIDGLTDAAAVAVRVEQHLEHWFGAMFRLDDSEIPLRARAGIAMYPGDGRDVETLFRNAESALKKARSEQERLLFYDSQMSASVARKLQIEHQLRQAVEQEQFVLHYQPKVSLSDGRLIGFEALLRWNHPQRGLVSPAEFIPVLEETGLIREAGEWVMRRAAQDFVAWRDVGLPAPRIAVNVSAVQLRRSQFFEQVEAARRIAGTDAALDIEITESVLVSDMQRSSSALQRLRELGMRTAIDDFGTGYSSLAYLARLPVDVLKIDRLFVSQMLDDAGARTLVETIVTLARSLRLESIAEGVETEAQAEALRAMGCDKMQGYLVSRPLPFADVTAKLRRMMQSNSRAWPT